MTGTLPGRRARPAMSAGAEIEYDFSYNNVGQLASETVSDPLVALFPQGLGTDLYVAPRARKRANEKNRPSRAEAF